MACFRAESASHGTDIDFILGIERESSTYNMHTATFNNAFQEHKMSRVRVAAGGLSGFFVILIKYYVKKLFWHSCYDFHFSLYHCSRTLHSIDNSPKITPYYQRQVTKEKLISLYIL